MKSLGVDWIGDVPEHWAVKRLKYIAAINKEALPETTDGDFEIQYIDIGNVTLGRLLEPPKPMLFKDAPSRARRIVKQNDTIVSTVRTYLKAIALIEDQSENLIASTGFAVVSPHNFLDHKFLFHLISSPRIIDRICALSVGVSYPSINSSDLANIEVWLPMDKSEQTAIAHYLDRKTAQIDQAISEKERLIELFREERQAIINHAVTKGIRAGVKMKPSGVEWIGDVPEGWVIVALKRRCSVIDCKHTTPIYSDEGIPIVSPGDLKPYTISLNGSRKITEEQFKDLTEGERMPSLGDIIYSRNASVGSAAFVDGKEAFCMGQDVCLIRSTHFEPVYLEALLNSHFVVEQLQSIMVGSTFKRINISQIKEFKLLVPSPQEQSEILVYMKSKTTQIDTAISGIQQEIALLQEYRQALIFEAVTGKIDVQT